MLRKKNLTGFESLEQKKMLTCNALVDGESVEVNCDDAGDFILVQQQNDEVVLGIDGQFLNLGSVKNIEFNTGGGNDAVILNGLDIDGNLKVNTGEGTDVVTLASVNIGKNATIKTGADNDNVFISGGPSSIGKNLKVDLGDGDDSFNAFAAAIEADKNVTLDGGAGNDTLVDSFFGPSNISAGKNLKIRNFEV